VSKKKSQTEEEKELLKMAAEQFARLFWKQWEYNERNNLKESRIRNSKKRN